MTKIIALLNTLDKAFELILATCISYSIETHSFLQNTNIGGRKIGSTEDKFYQTVKKKHAKYYKRYIFFY